MDKDLYDRLRDNLNHNNFAEAIALATLAAVLGFVAGYVVCMSNHDYPTPGPTLG